MSPLMRDLLSQPTMTSWTGDTLADLTGLDTFAAPAALRPAL
ncbi:hypothetical protein [Streptomyces sp. MBT53]|nr:hypothetical protein [Streptomyces sp. MBT53]